MRIEVSGQNRWLVVLGGVLIQLCLGIIYAWSVFTVPLSASYDQGGMEFTSSQTAWVFSTGLFVFSIFMIVSGAMMKKGISTRTLASLGGVCLGMGYVLAAVLGEGFLSILFSIGVLGGAGIGLAYAVPLKVGISWYPDKVGMVSGLAVAGFGFGAMFWVKAAGSWYGGLLNKFKLFDFPSLQSTFLLYGMILMILVFIGARFMKLPPIDYQPKGWITSEDKVKNSVLNLRGFEIVKTKPFQILFIMFFLSAFAGLMVIYCIKLFGMDALEGNGISNALSIAGTAMAVYAVMNGLGRIIYGKLSDVLGRKKTLTFMFFFQSVMMGMFFWLGQSSIGLIIGAGLIGLNFGGNFALFPALTARYFGGNNVGANYGWVFLAYGFAGVSGPLLSGVVKDQMMGSEGMGLWMIPFLSAAGACFIAGVLSRFLKEG